MGDVKREFRKCTWVEKSKTNEDAHIVSELITKEDGTVVRQIRIIENYKRPYFVTKPFYRKRHVSKIEYEDVSRVERVECTDSDAVKVLSSKLGIRGKLNMRRVKMSPYLYWGDMRASTIIKRIYNSKLTGTFTPYKVCMLDIEAGVIDSVISLVTVSMDDHSVCFINKEWVGDVETKAFTQAVYDAYSRDAPDVESVIDGVVTLTDGSSYTIELIYCRHEGEVIERSIGLTHEWRPDILTAWNALYDMSKLVSRAKEAWGMDPVDLFSDPSIPRHLRRFSIKEDNNDYKRMNSGKESFVDFHQRWHIFTSTSYYTILDNMAAFYYIRNGSESGVAGGYGLDNILDNYMKFKKLKPDIPEVEGLDKATWNMVMSEKYKPEYAAYNIFDSKSMILLDAKTKDLTINLPLLSQDSEFDIFKSGPRRLLDSYTFFLLDNDKVVGTKSPLMEQWEGLGTKDWIVTLDAWKKGFKNTFKTFKHIDKLRGNLRLLTTDLDIISSYPFQTLMFGLGTTRTSRELLDIEGFEQTYFTKHNLGLCTGRVQALTYCSSMLNLPTAFELKDYIDKKGIDNILDKAKTE